MATPSSQTATSQGSPELPATFPAVEIPKMELPDLPNHAEGAKQLREGSVKTQIYNVAKDIYEHEKSTVLWRKTVADGNNQLLWFLGRIERMPVGAVDQAALALPGLGMYRLHHLAEFENLYYITCAKIRDLHNQLDMRLSNGFIGLETVLHNRDIRTDGCLKVTARDMLRTLGEAWYVLMNPELVSTLQSAVKVNQYLCALQAQLNPMCGSFRDSAQFEVIVRQELTKDALAAARDVLKCPGLVAINQLSPAMIAAHVWGATAPLRLQEEAENSVKVEHQYRPQANPLVNTSPNSQQGQARRFDPRPFSNSSGSDTNHFDYAPNQSLPKNTLRSGMFPQFLRQQCSCGWTCVCLQYCSQNPKGPCPCQLDTSPGTTSSQQSLIGLGIDPRISQLVAANAFKFPQTSTPPPQQQQQPFAADLGISQKPSLSSMVARAESQYSDLGSGWNRGRGSQLSMYDQPRSPMTPVSHRDPYTMGYSDAPPHMSRRSKNRTSSHYDVLTPSKNQTGRPSSFSKPLAPDAAPFTPNRLPQSHSGTTNTPRYNFGHQDQPLKTQVTAEPSPKYSLGFKYHPVCPDQPHEHISAYNQGYANKPLPPIPFGVPRTRTTPSLLHATHPPRISDPFALPRERSAPTLTNGTTLTNNGTSFTNDTTLVNGINVINGFHTTPSKSFRQRRFISAGGPGKIDERPDVNWMIPTPVQPSFSVHADIVRNKLPRPMEGVIAPASGIVKGRGVSGQSAGSRHAHKKSLSSVESAEDASSKTSTGSPKSKYGSPSSEEKKRWFGVGIRDVLRSVSPVKKMVRSCSGSSAESQ